MISAQLNFQLNENDLQKHQKLFSHTQHLSYLENHKTPSRTEVINYLLGLKNSHHTSYLEIGVRNPDDNFNHIQATEKYGVDPGLEFVDNPVKYKITSDDFFSALKNDQLLGIKYRFDVIFIDGLHLAEQVDIDIQNALMFLKDDGFIVLHDCNPPTEWHAREMHDYLLTPASIDWNGTTWKAFLKWRFNPEVYSCCIDSDWGVGILAKNHPIGNAIKPVNPFFEFEQLKQNRVAHLNLIDFDTLKSYFDKGENHNE